MKVKDKRDKLLKEYFETLEEVKPSRNLKDGIVITVYRVDQDNNPLDFNAEVTTAKVYHYEHKEALKRLISIDGKYDVKVTYAGDNVGYMTDYVKDNIEALIMWASMFQSVKIDVIAHVLTHYGNTEKGVDMLARHIEEGAPLIFN